MIGKKSGLTCELAAPTVGTWTMDLDDVVGKKFL